MAARFEPRLGTIEGRFASIEGFFESLAARVEAPLRATARVLADRDKER